jgi:hypothetical protein
MTVGKHGSNEDMAVLGTILRVRTGSVVHGISTESSDRDEVGVTIESPAHVIGLRTFEQYMYRDAAQRTGKFDARSYGGDLDLTIYSLRKFVRLALNGNPSIIETLFTPAEHVIQRTWLGKELQELAPSIVSLEAAPRYLGYLMAQRRSMESHNGKGRDVTRPELVERYGFDTKYAGHMVRLGFQGAEVLETGRITLPMREGEREIVKAIRHGEIDLENCLWIAEAQEAKIKRLTHDTHLPAHPDRDAMDEWLIRAYQKTWG